MYIVDEINNELTITVKYLRPMSELKPFQRALVYVKSERNFITRVPSALPEPNDDHIGWIPIPVLFPAPENALEKENV